MSFGAGMGRMDGQQMDGRWIDSQQTVPRGCMDGGIGGWWMDKWIKGEWMVDGGQWLDSGWAMDGQQMMDGWWMDRQIIDEWWMDRESLVQVKESCVARAGHLMEGRGSCQVGSIIAEASAALGAGRQVSL